MSESHQSRNSRHIPTSHDRHRLRRSSFRGKPPARSRRRDHPAHPRPRRPLRRGRALPRHRRCRARRDGPAGHRPLFPARRSGLQGHLLAEDPRKMPRPRRGGRAITSSTSIPPSSPRPPRSCPTATPCGPTSARALGIPPERVGIKATTNETMGFVGRKEGIAAMAVAQVE